MSTTGPRIGGLFEGYGGLTRGVQAVLGGTVVWHSEIDPDASRILAHYWPDVPNLGDITKIDWSQVELVDVLTGGFPCQDLSTAGSRHGMTPTNRSGLWSHFAYAISQLRPALVVIENVRGLLTSRGAEPTEELLAAWDERDRVARIVALIERKHRKAIREGKDFYVQQHATDRLRFMGRHRRAVAAVRRADARIVRAIGTVLGDLARLGYDAQWHGLRAADIGAPHGRFRIFVVAHPAGQPWSFGHRDDVRTRSGTDRRGPAAGQSAVADTRGEHREQWRVGWPESARLIGRPDAALGSDAATDAERGGCDGRALVEVGQSLERVAAAGRGEVDWGQYAPAIARWERALGRVAPAPTEPGAKGGQRLSPRFVEWMQGLPEGHVTDPAIGISRNAQLKALGNGVVPQQAAAAVSFLLTASERAA